MTTKPVLAILGFAITLSACFGEDGTGSSLDGAGSFAANGSVIVGLVVSEEIFPVVGAMVEIVGGPATTTDAAGQFTLEGPPPGSRLLNVTAEGYEPLSRELEVPVEGIMEVQLTMIGIPGKAPYVTTLIFNGYDVCSLSAVYTAGWINAVPCLFGSESKKTWFKTEVGPDWRAGVHEMTWRGAEEMIFASSVSTKERPDGVARCNTSGSSHSYCPAMVWGRSPQRIFARPLDVEYAAKYAIDQKETFPEGNFTNFLLESYSGYLHQEINGTFYNQCVIINQQFGVPKAWGCPFGVGISLGIKFQFYHTTFYHQAPVGRLEDFTALPDG